MPQTPAPRGRGRPTITLESKLPAEWVEATSAMTVDDLRAEIAKVANDEGINQQLKKNDQQLAEAKQAHDDAGVNYKESSKTNKSKIEFALRVLADKGGI